MAVLRHEPSESVDVDVLVVGSGAGGLSAAVTAAVRGLDVLVIEKEARIGGSTARSGGWLWVPANPLARSAGIADDLEDARAYLRALAGPHYDAERVDAFLDHAPRMIEFMERETRVRFTLAPAYPDYEGRRPGASEGGRSMFTEPFDGRELGAELRHLALPMRESMFLGIAFNTGPELRHFFNATKSLTSALFVARRLARQFRDVLVHGRGTRLVSGNALAARLLRSALDRGVSIHRSSVAQELIVENGRVTGALVSREGRLLRVRARRGVVLATGGFSHDPSRTVALFPHVRAGARHASLTPAGNAGDGIGLAIAAGAAFDDTLSSPAAWAPVSVFDRADGSTGVYFHLIDRGKPGVIAVSPAGRRFVNESDSYHRFVLAMMRDCMHEGDVYAWLVGDHAALRKYGMGAARPAPLPIGRLLKSGYLRHGDTVAELARRIDMDPTALEATIARFNDAAQRGEDPDFGKGSVPYNRLVGDPENRPNPCVRGLGPGPFYAVRIVPGDLGTFAGLRTDTDARVLGTHNAPIAGLYAVGNDAASVCGGSYPGAGAMLAPAMAFGWRCGEALASGEVEVAEGRRAHA
jgi:succinate dehydrogenase/fumarate reductase flavoprotein subunit